jgi:hypothetical protein
MKLSFDEMWSKPVQSVECQLNCLPLPYICFTYVDKECICNSRAVGLHDIHCTPFDSSLNYKPCQAEDLDFPHLFEMNDGILTWYRPQVSAAKYLLHFPQNLSTLKIFEFNFPLLLYSHIQNLNYATLYKYVAVVPLAWYLAFWFMMFYDAVSTEAV